MLEQEDKMKYLGCRINNKLDPNREIKCKLKQAKYALTQTKWLLKWYVLAVLLYGAESSPCHA